MTFTEYLCNKISSNKSTLSPALISVDSFKVVLNSGSRTENGALQRDKHFGKVWFSLKTATEILILLVTFPPTMRGATISFGSAFCPLLLHL